MAVPLGIVQCAHATEFAGYVSYVQGAVPSYLQQYNDAQVIGSPPVGTTGAQFGFPGVVTPFNPPFDTDQIALVGIGGQLTLQFPHPLNVGSGPEIGVFSNVGLADTNYPNGQAASPATIFGGGSALFSVSEDGTSWFDLGPATVNIPQNFYLNAGPYDQMPPSMPQTADFSAPFTGKLSSFDGQNYPRIVTTLNGSAGGTWLNLFGSGLSQINFLRVSEPPTQPAGSYLAIQAVSVANQLHPAHTWSPSGAGSWSAPAHWTNNLIPGQPEDAAVFPAANSPATVTLDGDRTVGHIAFGNGSSYTISPGTAGTLTLDNGPAPATIQVHGAHAISTPLRSAGAVTIFGSGTLTLNASATLAGPLSVQGTTTVDIGTHSVAINYSSAADQQAAVAGVLSALSSAYHAPSGPWSGAGLTSSAAAANPGRFAIGYADGNADLGTTAQPNQLLVKYTFNGDANLDGTVGFPDLLAVAQHYGATGADWSQGNFTYDPTGLVGFPDLLIVAQNYGLPMNNATSLSLSRATAVPEPAGASLLIATILATRRKRSAR